MTRPGVGMNFNAGAHRTAQKQKSSDRPKFSEIGEDCRVNFSGGAISRSVQMMGIIGSYVMWTLPRVGAHIKLIRGVYPNGDAD